ncbi:MYXO-CTERM domain-containing protein [Roseateles sp. YR242]|uniref:hypothetical protein n=1 Tax=Roseateles sp. YR242 TaxID=1855305 RepID=UPI0008D6CCB0|nr:hypothetical protein [Roseateles sp. YR242]SEL19307.1 MYXO-CTERM domain-containing protein [Roseateles sp. YR242]
MSLRKLVWMAPLLMAVATAQAEATSAPATATQTQAKPVSVQATAAREEPNAPRDIKALMALVGGLALVGWVQRRRRDA